ncbi:type 4a pilus biogenesis protein PilO [Caballeronia sp. LZ032]|uniref:type 4a pilus biogenesis protein PilO n=1 Tax=Caballeronia sp. LZ032 TaxID=3038565 RepID=UPI00286298A9|nr:type 4a pilus biogenesis protein PilO [Caballeronia sp. LZ032]MDR5879283.1 type 4a pilus biogenesis protein PilO [Caballeronia sp. LZ032]
MNAMPMNLLLHRDKRRNMRVAALLRPLDAWSRTRLAASALALTLLVGVAGTTAWRMSDPGGLELARAELTAAQTREHEVRRIRAELPGLKARALSARLQPEQWSTADALRAVVELAAQSGLRDVSIEPAARAGAGPEAPSQVESGRPLKLRAEGSFNEIHRFLEALAGLPRLVVPEGAQIRQPAGVRSSGGLADALAVEASLRVFENQPGIPLTVAAPRASSFVIDPFGGGDALAQGGDILLVGTLVGTRRAMALLQSGSEVSGYAPGQKIGAERLAWVVPRVVELMPDRGPSRKLTMAEDRK